MKTKFIVLFIILTMLFALASCSTKPELNFRQAEKNLESEDYTVEYEDDDDELDVGIVEELDAVSEDGDDFVYIVRLENAKYAKLMYEQLKLEYDGEIERIQNEIKRYEYILDKFSDDLDSYEIDEYEDDIKDLKKELEEMKDDYAFGRKGDIVWAGTKIALEDSKK